jgi:SAM-dependent methyltransferase
MFIERLKKFIRWFQRVAYHLQKAVYRRLLVHRVSRNGSVFYKYKGEFYPEYLNDGNALSFILDTAENYCKGHGVDIGAGKWPYPGAMPVYDESYQNALKLDDIANQSLDYVISSHCLEHISKWQQALRLWIQKLKVNGILFIYLPHPSMKLWRPGAPWVGNSHKWSPSQPILIDFLRSNNMGVVEYNRSMDKYWSFHIVARKLR